MHVLEPVVQSSEGPAPLGINQVVLDVFAGIHHDAPVVGAARGAVR